MMSHLPGTFPGARHLTNSTNTFLLTVFQNHKIVFPFVVLNCSVIFSSIDLGWKIYDYNDQYQSI